MTQPEAIAQLKQLWSAGMQYAQEAANQNNDPANGGSVFVNEFHALNFDDASGLGYAVTNSQTDWATWATQFKTAVRDTLAYRALWLYGQATDPTTDTSFNWTSISIFASNTAGSPNDPMLGWNENIVDPTFASLAVLGAVMWAVQPLADATNALGDVGNWAIGGVAAIIIILILLVLFRAGI